MTVGLDKIKTCIDWGADDQARIERLRRCVGSDLQAIVDDLAEYLVQYKDAQSLMTNARFVEHLDNVLHEWLDGLLEGTFDEAYVQTRQALVQNLAEIDLAFDDIILLQGIVRTRLCELARERLDGLFAVTRALDKAMRLDMALIYAGYTRAREAEIERSLLDRFLTVTGFSRTLYENLSEARGGREIHFHSPEIG